MMQKIRNIIYFSVAMLVLPGMVYAQEGLRDIKDPLPFRDIINYRSIAIVLLFILVLVGLYFLIKRIIRKKPALPEIKKTPAQIALFRLSELKSMNLPQNGKIKEYFTVLSDILRRYIEDQFDISAPEMTTEEFLNSIDREYKVDRAHMVLLKDFLSCCDMVKFAKYDARDNEVDNTFNSAMRFVNETKGIDVGATNV